MTSDGNHYNPNQPRVPAGHARGGQWTSGEHGARSEERARPFRRRQDANGTHVETYNADGSINEELRFNSDGSAIRSQYASADGVSRSERHTVRLADKSVFDIRYADDVQRVYAADGTLLSARRWGEDGAEDLPIVEARFRPRAGTANPSPSSGLFNGISAALATLSAVFTARQAGIAVLEFRSRSYEKGAQLEATYTGELTEEQVQSVCGNYGKIMGWLAQDAAMARAMYPGAKPARLGTIIHRMMEDRINQGFERDAEAFIKFRAEHSLRKSAEAERELLSTYENPRNRGRYGERNTVRIDIFEHLGDGVICVYDIKTGEKVLAAKRMDEIAAAVVKHYGGYKKIIVLEVRPPKK